MTNSEIKKVLTDNGVQYLYHANTVATSITFLKQGGLRSRQWVEERHLTQTFQKSDDKDKELGIYNDIFFDPRDLHVTGNRVNYYGPVTFVYSVDLLDDVPEGVIKVTRKNPVYWETDTAETERYFTEYEDYKGKFNVGVDGAFGQSVTLRNCGAVSFDRLERVILDDPGRNEKNRFTIALNNIRDQLSENCPRIQPEIRVCKESCKCRDLYAEMSDSVMTRFFRPYFKPKY